MLFPSAQVHNSWDEGGSATMAAAGQVLLAQLWDTIQVPSLALKAFDVAFSDRCGRYLFGCETALAAHTEVSGASE